MQEPNIETQSAMVEKKKLYVRYLNIFYYYDHYDEYIIINECIHFRMLANTVVMTRLTMTGGWPAERNRPIEKYSWLATTLKHINYGIFPHTQIYTYRLQLYKHTERGRYACKCIYL